uniref:Uncharacterized protein n=1 Tax=Calla Lily Valley virus TaxID=3139873 RepID=A0AAN0N6I7_9VIRU
MFLRNPHSQYLDLIKTLNPTHGIFQMVEPRTSEMINAYFTAGLVFISAEKHFVLSMYQGIESQYFMSSWRDVWFINVEGVDEALGLLAEVTDVGTYVTDLVGEYPYWIRMGDGWEGTFFKVAAGRTRRDMGSNVIDYDHAEWCLDEVRPQLLISYPNYFAVAQRFEVRRDGVSFQGHSDSDRRSSTHSFTIGPDGVAFASRDRPEGTSVGVGDSTVPEPVVSSGQGRSSEVVDPSSSGGGAGPVAASDLTESTEVSVIDDVRANLLRAAERLTNPGGHGVEPLVEPRPMVSKVLKPRKIIHLTELLAIKELGFTIKDISASRSPDLDYTSFLKDQCTGIGGWMGLSQTPRTIFNHVLKHVPNLDEIVERLECLYGHVRGGHYHGLDVILSGYDPLGGASRSEDVRKAVDAEQVLFLGLLSNAVKFFKWISRCGDERRFIKVFHGYISSANPMSITMTKKIAKNVAGRNLWHDIDLVQLYLDLKAPANDLVRITREELWGPIFNCVFHLTRDSRISSTLEGDMVQYEWRFPNRPTVAHARGGWLCACYR